MLNEEIIEKVNERVISRIEQANTYVLSQIGKTIKKIGKLTPTEAMQLVEVLKYGGDYDKIAQELARVSELNVKDIYDIFDEIAKKDYRFAEKFYKYRNIKYIPYEKNLALKNQVRAMAKLTADSYLNITNTLAFAIRTPSRTIYPSVARTYQRVIDKAVLSVVQGKSTFQDEMYRTIKELASSGIRTIDYQSGRSYRLDSSVRTLLETGISTMHNEVQEIIGNEYGADGVEISVHENPAPDHEEVQGHQFSTIRPKESELSEWEKLQEGQQAKDYKGNTYSLDHDDNGSYRPIGTLNCKHYTFSIVLGVDEQEYSDKELQEIRNANDKGFELDGKHYTLYEGTQLQRKLELEIRKQKDTQIMARESYDNALPDEKNELKELISESQVKITELTTKYKELSEVSGLKTKMQRMRVPTYKRINTKKL